MLNQPIAERHAQMIELAGFVDPLATNGSRRRPTLDRDTLRHLLR